MSEIYLLRMLLKGTQLVHLKGNWIFICNSKDDVYKLVAFSHTIIVIYCSTVLLLLHQRCQSSSSVNLYCLYCYSIMCRNIMLLRCCAEELEKVLNRLKLSQDSDISDDVFNEIISLLECEGKSSN